ncbi:hypothetical protein GQ54DRAFT_298464 [Martensiomyces pterosporus]|nr:hypothetical protein GQ54DRAFT_298464 [Martensiomyces pterosporus]
MEATSEKERLLRISRKVNSAAIRIALYPFAPLAWWIMIVVFYRVQYDLTMTFKSDVPKFVRMLKLSWYSSSAAAFVNFLVFLTDPAVLGVIREVRRAIADKLLRRRGLAKVAPQQQPDQSALCDRSSTLHGSHVSKALNHHDSDSTASLGLAKEARYDLAGAERGHVGLVNTALRYGDDDDGCSNTTTIAQL